MAEAGEQVLASVLPTCRPSIGGVTNKRDSSTHEAFWWEEGASGPGTGCFLCPTFACISVCHLAHGQDERLGQKRQENMK